MKKTMLVFLACLFAVSAMGQTPTAPIKGWGFAGGLYTHAVTGKDGGLATMGFLTHVTGPLYTAARIDVGHYGVVNNDWVILNRVQQSPLYIGLVGGLDGTFKPDSATSFIAYLNGAGGLLASVQTKWAFLGFHDLNFWGTAKYHFAFEGGTAYQDGWTVGLGVALPWD